MRTKLIICISLLVATLVVFSQTVFHQFVNLDDFDYVTQNPHVISGISFANVAWAFTSFHASNWHPLTWISHMLDAQLFGLRPAGHHLTSLLLHAANVVLLFLLLCRISGTLWRSAFVAALFAIHPLHVESVAWVAERKDVLSTLFLLLTLLSYAGYARNPAWKTYLLTVILFALGLMAKPMLVTVPFLMLLLDYWPLRRYQSAEMPPNPDPHADTVVTCSPLKLPWRQLLLEKIPFLILSLGCGIVTIYAQRTHAIISLKNHPFPDRLANAVIAYAGYIGNMLWPRDLAAFYPIPATVPGWQIAGSAVLLVTCTIIAVITRKRFPYLVIGWFWFMGMLVPVIGLLQVGMQARADRYTYIPLVGLFIIVTWGCSDLAAALRFKQRLISNASATLLILLAVATWFQVSYWKDTQSLFSHAVEVTTDNWFAHTFLGMALDGQGQHDLALTHLNAALRSNPEFGKTHYALGVALARSGSLDDAIGHYRAAVRFEPNLSEAYNNLANALAAKGRIGEADDLLMQGISIDPENARLHYNLAVNLELLNRFDEALFHYREAVRVNPAYAAAHNNLGFLALRTGNIQEAVPHLIEAVRINPGLTTARDEIESLLARGVISIPGR